MSDGLKPIRAALQWESGIPKGVRYLGYRVVRQGETRYANLGYSYSWVTESPQWGFWKKRRTRSMRGK